MAFFGVSGSRGSVGGLGDGNPKSRLKRSALKGS